MRRMRRTALTIGVLMMALLPVTAAVSTDAAARDAIPVAITQPIGHMTVELTPGSSPVTEPGVMMLVGCGLLGLGTVVRRSTRV